MHLLFLLACDPPTSAPKPPPVEEIKPRVSLRSLTAAGAGTHEEAPQTAEQVQAESRGCGVDIDMRTVSLDNGFEEQGVSGVWGRTESEPYVLHAPTTGCVLLAPAKLTLEIPQELGCERAVLELNVGCGMDCGHACSVKGGGKLTEWKNSGNGKESVELSGPMDGIEVWSSGMEICRVQLF